MTKKNIIWGVILGLLVPIIGVFAGLQISTALGSVLAFPFIALAYITGTFLGEWSLGMFVAALLLSIAEWVLILTLIDKLRNH